MSEYSIPKPPCWRWQVEHGLAGIDRLAEQWNRLAHSSKLSPTADAIWMRCFWRAFGEMDEDLSLHCLYDGDELTAVLPFQRQGTVLRTWKGVMNKGHTPYWMCALADGRPDAGGEIIDHLLRSAEVIDLMRVRSDGPLRTALLDATATRPVSVWWDDVGADAFIKLFSPWEEFVKTFPKKVIGNIRRRRRILEKAGKLTFEINHGGDRLSELVDECMELETRGWKSQSGTTILSNPVTKQFYHELAKEMSAAGRLAIYVLRLDGRMIAFEYCIRAQGKIDALKESYDPEWSRCSPSQVLRLNILQHEIEQGGIAGYHLGRPSQWKLRWASDVERLGRLRIYRRSLRSAAAYYGGPRLRATLKKSPALRAAVQRSRTITTNLLALAAGRKRMPDPSQQQS